MDDNHVIAKIYDRLAVTLHYFWPAWDARHNVGMAEEAFTPRFKGYLESAGFKTRFLQKEKAYLSDNGSRSIIYNVINATPTLFKWSVDGVERKRSQLSVRFVLPLYLRIKLYLWMIILAIIQFGVLPWFGQRIAPTDIFLSSVHKLILCFMVFLGMFSSGVLLALLQRYRNCLSDLEENFGQLANITRSTPLPFHEYPIRICGEWTLFVIALLITFLPLIRISAYSLSALNVVVVTIFSLFMIYFGGVLIRGMKGSLPSIRITGLIDNFTVIFLTVANLVLIPYILYVTSTSLHVFRINAEVQYNTEIAQLLGDSASYPTEWVADVRNRLGAAFVVVVGFQVFLFVVTNTVFYVLTFSNSSPSIAGRNRREIKSIFRSKSPCQGGTLGLPSGMKDSVNRMFQILSAFVWLALLLNLPIVLAFAFPSVPILHMGYGRVIHSALYELTNVLPLGEDFPFRKYLPLVLIAPLLLVFLSFVLGNIYYALKSSLQYCLMRRVKNGTQSMVDRIAMEMGVHNVRCLLDSRKNRLSYSPSAVISDIGKRKIILFTKNSLQFIKKHTDYAEAIIAHEIAHLKLHCAQIRENTMKSRWGFVGCNFLSLMYDSITMEDEADEEAKKYLSSHNLDKSLIKKAAFKIGILNCQTENGISCNIEQVNLAALPPVNKRIPVRRPIFIVDFMLATYRAYEIYFGTVPYDYIHRDAKYR